MPGHTMHNHIFAFLHNAIRNSFLSTHPFSQALPKGKKTKLACALLEREEVPRNASFTSCNLHTGTLCRFPHDG